MINYILSLVIIQFRLSTSWIKFGKLSFSKSFSIFLCFQIYWHNISIIFFLLFLQSLFFFIFITIYLYLLSFFYWGFLEFDQFYQSFQRPMSCLCWYKGNYCINELFCFINCCSRLYYHLPLGFFPFFSFSNFLSWILVH